MVCGDDPRSFLSIARNSSVNAATFGLSKLITIIPAPVSPVDGAADAPPSAVPAQDACTPASSQYRHGQETSVPCAGRPRAPPYAWRSCAAAYAGWHGCRLFSPASTPTRAKAACRAWKERADSRDPGVQVPDARAPDTLPAPSHTVYPVERSAP